jgi:Acyl-CoA dehydrogenase N terminal
MNKVNSGVLSRRDLDFLLFEWLRVDELAKRQRFADHTTETFAGMALLGATRARDFITSGRY